MNKFFIENKFLKVTILSVGASIFSIKRKEDDLELVTQLPEEKYQNDNYEAHGVIVGPAAGRICTEKIKVNGVEHIIPNFKDFLLHSGKERLGHMHFTKVSGDDKEITLTCFYKNKKYDFLSDQKVVVTYRLASKSLICVIKSFSDSPKIMNYTNHTYFTLGANDSKQLLIKGDIVGSIETHDSTITGNVWPLEQTNWDFSKYKAYDTIDDPFVLKPKGASVWVLNPENKLALEVITNQRAVVIYNDCYSSMEQKHKGIAIEMQGYPSAISYSHFPQNVFKSRKNQITYKFHW